MRVLLALIALAVCVSAAPHFDVLQNTTSKKFHFNLVGGNGEIILTSELYEKADGVRKGIVAVMAVGASKENFEKKQSAPANAASKSKPYYVLKGDNNEVVGVSEMFEGGNAERSIESLNKIIYSIDDELAKRIEQKDAVLSATSPCKFEIQPSKDGKHFFHLKARNNEIVAVSETYNSAADLLNGISSVLRNCGAKKHLQEKTSKDNQHFVHCVASGNNKILINTETYKKAKTAEEAVKLIQDTVRVHLKNYAKSLKTKVGK